MRLVATLTLALALLAPVAGAAQPSWSDDAPRLIRRASLAEASFGPSRLARAAGPETPGSFALGQARPNPFTAFTRLTFGVEQAGTFTVAVYDALGRRVATLHEGVTSRSQFRQTLDGQLLGDVLWSSDPLALPEVGLDAAGTIPFTIPLGEPDLAGEPTGVVLEDAGVHPVRVELRS